VDKPASLLKLYETLNHDTIARDICIGLLDLAGLNGDEGLGVAKRFFPRPSTSKIDQGRLRSPPKADGDETKRDIRPTGEGRRGLLFGVGRILSSNNRRSFGFPPRNWAIGTQWLLHVDVLDKNHSFSIQKTMSKPKQQVVDFATAGHQSITDLSSDDEHDENCEIEQHQQGGKKRPAATMISEEGKRQQERPSRFAQDLSSFRAACGSFVNSNTVQWLVVILIIINAIMMGVATFNFVEDSPKISLVFEMADFAFLVLFTCELLLQFIAHGVIGTLADGWMCFDTFIIIASWSFAHFQVARAFRIVRALRLATRLEALRSILQALATVAPSVGCIAALLMLCTY
jgi:hypothetical protein